MEGFIICPLCKFWKDHLVQANCCSAKYCEDCITNLKTEKSKCPRCKKQLVFKEEIYIPLNTLLNSVLTKCKYEGCDVMTTEIMRKSHEERCKFAPDIKKNELIAALCDDVLTREQEIEKKRNNLLKSYITLNPEAANAFGEDYITHIILDTETLQGIGLKYDVSVSEIKKLNRMTTDALHERTLLKIPVKNMQSNYSSDPAQLEDLLKKRLIGRFKRDTKTTSNDEALYYLENNFGDYDAAVKEYRSDIEWEKQKNLPKWAKACKTHSKNKIAQMDLESPNLTCTLFPFC